uniref:Uncharacterized protein n=1 Tax=Panagrolaimus sp. ES5 TaxID=591445 RepID=A0AC34FSB1_9BILA
MAFSLSVSFGGQFTLGCAQPSCLKFPIIENPTFAFVNGVKDGFVNLPLISEKTFINNRAQCESNFGSSNCTGEDQWLAGIAPISDLSNLTDLSLRCCKHWAMKVAKFEKVVTIKKGESFGGGDIYDSEDEEVIAFDYITNIEKIDTDNETFFEIVINRLPCNLEGKESEEFSRNNNVTLNNRIHQAPLVETGDYPAVDYDSVTENENDETSTQNIASSDATAIAEENGYNINLSPPDTTVAAPLQSQTLSATIEIQTVKSTQLKPQNQSIQQQQIGQTKDSYAQPGSSIPNQQQQSSYAPDTTVAAPLQSQTLSATIEIQTVESTQLKPQNQSIQQQQIGQTKDSYAQPGSSTQNQQQQSSYVNPLMPPSNNPYQAPFHPMHPMPALFMNPAQNQFFNNPQQQSYPSQTAGSSSSNGYYPVSQQQSAASSGCCSNMMCFTGDMLVTLMNGTKKRMDELTVNDWVLSAGGNRIGYSKINSWLHKKPKLITEFIKFTLENGNELKMTKKHFIFKSDCSNVTSPVKVETAIQRMVYAENVSINDCLFVITKNKKLIQIRISKIEIVKEKGIYSPMTNNGNIIVNDIFASCFNIVQNDVVQITFPSIIKKIKNLFSKLWYSDAITDSYYHQQSQSEIDLIPGLRGLVEIVKYVVPSK